MDAPVMVSVRGLYKNFKLPHEKSSGLKQAIINFHPGKKSYEVQHVLQDISFDIKQGEFFGIVGRNGSGKSTLLKLLAQIYTPNQGSVSVHGTLTPFIELGVGFNPELTGRENVYLNGALLGFDRKQTDAMFGQIVDFAEIHEFMDQKLKNYSSGMQVRLAFSIAIRAKSDILLIDEVLAVGDAAFQQKCFDYFEELKLSNTTVILVTHDMSAVTRFCTRALIIENGRIKAIGKPEEIADIYTLDNIKGRNNTDDEDSLLSKNNITANLMEQSKGYLTFEVEYNSKDTEDMYIGIAILRDGISVAEITTSQERTLKDRGKVSYTLDTTLLNAGVYDIGVGLFRLKNKELIGAVKNRIHFVIEGRDITRGAALKLADTWKYQ